MFRHVACNSAGFFLLRAQPGRALNLRQAGLRQSTTGLNNRLLKLPSGNVRRKSTTNEVGGDQAAPPFMTMFAIGLAGGTFGAIMGLAGGVVIVPAIVTFSSITQKSAIGTSLVAALAVGSVGSANYALDGKVDFVNALVIAAGSSITAGMGARFAQGLPDRTLKTVLGIYMLVMAAIVPARDALLKTVWKPALTEGGTAIEQIPKKKTHSFGELDWDNIPVFFVTGLFAGFASGMFGIAGGTIVTPTLAVFTSLTQPQVLGTSLTAGIIPTILASRSFYNNGFVVMKAVPPIVLGAASGATLGSRIALHLKDEELRLCFSGGMVALGLRVLLTRK